MDALVVVMSLHLSSDPDTLRQQFFQLKSRDDLLNLLDISQQQLLYYLYICPENKRYRHLRLRKKRGGYRTIYAPATHLKIVQQKLSSILQLIYEQKPAVHGFVPHKSIVSNAAMHLNKTYVLNLDLQDFFPSINFGRVRGLFMNQPYYLNEEVATILAQICCHRNTLPQGAPTSPVISNMICAKLDRELLRFAQANRCVYTRYADDLTFSTNTRQPPSKLVRRTEATASIELGRDLVSIITANGFQVHPEKSRLQVKGRRQEVTGLTVNHFPNVPRRLIRQIRAMLHAWRKFGLDAAQQHYYAHYCHRQYPVFKPRPPFRQVLIGKIAFVGMVRGKHDQLYLRLRDQLLNLDPTYRAAVEKKAEETFILSTPLIKTEGKTDWKHIKHALRVLQAQGLYAGLSLDFDESLTEGGSSELKKTCYYLSRVKQAQIIIALFDRDEPNIIREVADGDRFKAWGNQVFSFVLPIPDHRTHTPDICIEFLYPDNNLLLVDEHGRRLYLSSEFHETSGRHKENPAISCLLSSKFKKDAKLSIIDASVFDANHRSIALAKDAFADYILHDQVPFNRMNLDGFKPIFDMIIAILRAETNKT